MDGVSLTLIIQIFSLTLVAWGFGSLVEGWAIHRYAPPQAVRLRTSDGSKEDGVLRVSWERSLFVAAVANGIALSILGFLHYLLGMKFLYLGNLDFGRFDIFFNWTIATMVANAIELSMVKWVFKIDVTRMIAFITSISNGLCALAELYVDLV